MSDQPTDSSGSTDADALDAFVERLLDLALYAPVGVAVTLRDELPRHVKQGRQALENRIQLARFIGQLAVQTGQRELQKRIEQQREARLAATTPAGDAESAADVSDVAAGPQGAATGQEAADARVGEPAAPVEAPETALDARDGGDAVPSAAELPISDYESLPAINVVDRLRSMSPDEIELVRRFEQAHRARRTILAKIDQLQERHAAE